MNSIEQMPEAEADADKFEADVRSTEELKLRNTIQKDLMARYAESVGSKSWETLVRWTDVHSRDFMKLMDLRPDLEKLYLEDKQAALTEIERLLG